MANYSTLKAAVADVVKTNGTQAITGANLQTVLLSIINSVGGGGYIFKGVATPSTDAGTPDENVFYVGGAGTYANFGTSVTVPVGSIGVFKYNGSWTSELLSVGLADDVSQLNKKVSVLDNIKVQYTTDNGYIANDGTIAEQTGEYYNEKYTSEIPVSYGAKYIFSIIYNTTRSMWCAYCLYNSSGTSLGRTVLINGQGDKATFNITISNKNAAYIRFTWRSFGEAIEGILVGDLNTLQNSVNANTSLKVDKAFVNLFNPNDTGNQDGYLNAGGSVSYLATYITSHYIPIEEGKTYYCATDGATGFERVLMYSDINVPITSSYISSATTNFVTATGAKYARVTFYVSNDKKQVSEYNIPYYPYNPISKYLYEIFGMLNAAQITSILTRIDDLEQFDESVPINKINKLTENIFCVKDIFIDNSYYANSDGHLISNVSTYACTQKIPVNKTYYYSYGFVQNSCFCWSDTAFLGQVQYNNSDERRYDLLDGTTYIAFNFQKFAQSEGYVDSGVIFNLQPFVEDYDAKIESIKSHNILYGKKWCVVGDSFTAWTTEQFTSGRFANKYKTYDYLIALRNEMNIYDMALSGRTMAYPNDHTFDNAFAKPSLYQSIPADSDYITIMLGINDESHLLGESQDVESVDGDITIGTIDSTDTGTFYGAWNVVMQWIFENRPDAHVGIIITNGLGQNGSAGTYTDKGMQVYQALKDIVVKWNVPHIDLNGGDGKTPMMQRGIYPVGTASTLIAAKWNAFATSPTGTLNGHTNAAGHLYESNCIENFLRTL